MLVLLLALTSVMFDQAQVHAAEIKVAVAANFSSPMQTLAADFFAETGHRLVISYGSTGKFFAQIKNGAPFEIFLSADQAHIKKLIQDKYAVTGTEFTYAIGRPVLWSKRLGVVDSSGTILKAGQFKHLAIANPVLAPYGLAAKEVLEKLGLWETLRPRLVIGENISQAYQFVATNNAELGFVAFSQINSPDSPGAASNGSFWIIPKQMYSPIRQDAVLLKKGRDSEAAVKFLEFMKGERARAIIIKYGYESP